MPRLPFIRAHSRLQEQVSAFVDNELAGREEARVRDHLDACAECAALARSFAGTKQLLAAMPAVEPPRSFRLTPAMVAATAPARSGPVQGRSQLPLRVAQMATAVAVMALAMVVVVDLGDSGSSNRQMAVPASAGGAESAGALTSKGAAADAAAPTVATVRPFNSGGVEGQGVTTPVPPKTGGTAAPAQAPSENRDGVSQEAPKPVSPAAGPSTTNDDAPYRWAETALGAVAIVAAAAMAVLWRSRRRNSDE